MNYSIAKKYSQVLVIAAISSLFFLSWAGAQRGNEYSREQVEAMVKDTIKELNGYIADLNQSIAEARNGGADKLAARLEIVLSSLKTELRLLTELQKHIFQLREAEIDQELGKIRKIAVDIRDVQMTWVINETTSLLKWVFGRKDRALREAISAAKEKQRKLTARILEVERIIAGTITSPLSESPSPPEKSGPVQPPSSTEPTIKPEPSLKPEPPSETNRNGWQPIRPPREKPQSGYIWLYDSQKGLWRQIPNWVYEDGRLVKKDPPPGAYLYIDSQGIIHRVSQSERPPPPPSSSGGGETGLQAVTCRRRGDWFYCDDVETGRPVVKYPAGSGQISFLIEKEIIKNPKAVFLYDPDKNQIIGVQKPGPRSIPETTGNGQRPSPSPSRPTSSGSGRRSQDIRYASGTMR